MLIDGPNRVPINFSNLLTNFHLKQEEVRPRVWDKNSNISSGYQDNEASRRQSLTHL